MTELRQWVSLRGVTADGADPDADYVLQAGLTGIGGAPPRDPGDLALVGEDGSISGPDYRATRVITVPVLIKRFLDGGVVPDPEAAMRAYRYLARAWAPSGTDTEEELRIYLPGYGPSDDVARFYGRPRTDMAGDLSRLAYGTIKALGSFSALDPLAYGPEVVDSGSGTVNVTNDGDVATRRATLTITGSGGTPVVSNPQDGGGSVAWLTALANGAVRHVNLRTATVTDAGGIDRGSEVATASTYFVLQTGVNALELTGATSLSVTHQPAYN